MDSGALENEPVAVVTGAARGLGRVVASTLAKQGYRLVLVDRSPLADAIADAESVGRDAFSVQADVSSGDAIAGLAAEALSRFGRVDVLVNNAGVSLLEPAEETSVDDWRRVLEINLTGPFVCCRHFGPMMLAAGSGSIVNPPPPPSTPSRE